MHALVLGGSRFVGLRLVDHLLAEGVEVTTLTRGTRPLPHPVHALHADRRQPEAVRRVLEGQTFDAAFDISAYRPDELTPVVQVLDGHVDRFVFISSVAVYSEPAERPYEETSARGRTAEWGDYGEDKVRCEEVLFQAHGEAGFPAVILRPPYVYGPHNYLYREAYFYDRIEAERPVPIPAGRARVQFSHVDDLAVAFLRAATRTGVEGEGFNIAGEEAVTFRELAELAAAAVGQPLTTNVVEDAERLRGHFPFRNLTVTLDVTKGSAALGLRPRPFGKGLRETYSWYQNARPFGVPDFAKDASLGGAT